ncbi:MAG: sigma-70 region 4 domain-containing protein [Actinomycetota bacterium]|nr:sigma-70 region 4 domain-containing protein [Actinomycetota bacterium]
MTALATTDDARLEAHEALERLVSLKARHRRAFVLRVAGYSYDEIAELMGVTRTAVDRYLRRARSHVRGTSRTPKRGARTRKLASATAS